MALDEELLLAESHRPRQRYWRMTLATRAEAQLLTLSEQASVVREIRSSQFALFSESIVLFFRRDS